MPTATETRRPTLSERSHMENCPGIEGEARIEEFDARRPARPDQAVPAQDVTVVRCIECGGATVKEKG